MRFEGSIDAFGLPDIFALLSMTRKSGGLHLRHGDRHGVVRFVDGQLTGGAADLTREALARRLVVGMDLPTDTLAAAVDFAGSEGVGLVAALRQLGLVSDERLRELAEEHIVDVVFDLMRWEAGDFEFLVDEPNPDEVGAACPVDEAVAQARSRLEAWNSERGWLPASDAVLRLAALPPDDIRLDREQWSLLVLLDGARTVADVVDLSGRSEYAVVRGLAELSAAGLIGDAGESAPEAARAALLDAYERRPAAPPRQSEPVGPTVSAPSEPTGIEPEPDSEPNSEGESGPDLEPMILRPTRHRQAEVGHSDTVPSSAPTNGSLAELPTPLSGLDPSVNKSLLLRLIAGVRGL